ncbi:hypothetical protein RRG08_033116 [Elysia crispata]|uniref:Uncharacterized protein n=1 Tax=Elysia crispata TaxID=231223 RepID=A0AAE1BAA8_9GAST|nr:hypothetical protein RRG08_033116 [Elysia crispata]
MGAERTFKSMEELEKEPTLSLSNHKRLSDRVDLSDYSLQMSRSMDKVKDLLNSYIENLMATEKCKVSRSSISLHPHNLETALDWYSLQAKEEMKQLMDKMTIAYAEVRKYLALTVSMQQLIK